MAAGSGGNALVSKGEMATSIVLYSLASGSMLLVNKFVMKHLPLPSTVATLQFVFAATSIAACKLLCKAEVDDFEWSKVRPYAVYVLAFVLGCYTNMKALEKSNVETVIVFRTCVPLCVGLLDWIFLGRELPSRRSAAALVLILTGAVVYVSADKQYEIMGLDAYFWVSLYFLTMCFSFTYGKHLVSKVELKSPIWGAVYYTNALSIVPMVLLGGAFGEADKLKHTPMPSYFVLALVLLSCIVGTCISYAGFRCRVALSATSYTVVGVVNKMLTIFVNSLIGDEHATPVGLASLALCLVGGALYRQAPMRTPQAPYHYKSLEAGEAGESATKTRRIQSQSMKKRLATLFFSDTSKSPLMRG